MKAIWSALRFIFGGVGLVVLGIGMLLSDIKDTAGWRLLIGGPLFAAVGVYLYVRGSHVEEPNMDVKQNGDTTPEHEPSPLLKRHLDIKQVGDITVVTFRYKTFLDFRLIEYAEKQLLALVDENRKGQEIVLDLGLLEYSSSKGLATLINLEKKIRHENNAKAADAKLRLCGIRPEIMEYWKITRLDKYIDIKPTLEDALDGF